MENKAEDRKQKIGSRRKEVEERKQKKRSRRNEAAPEKGNILILFL